MLAASTMSLQAGAATIDVLQSLDIVTGHVLGVASDSMRVESGSDMDVATGETASISANSAFIELSESVELSSRDLRVRSGERLELYAGTSVDIQTSDFSINGGGRLSAFSGNGVDVVTAEIVVDASDSILLNTGDFGLVASGAVAFSSTEAARVSTGEVELHTAGSAEMSSAADISITAADTLTVGAGHSVTAQVGDELAVTAGRVSVDSTGPVTLIAAGASLASSRDLIGYTSADIEIGAVSAATYLSKDLQGAVGGEVTLSVAAEAAVSIGGHAALQAQQASVVAAGISMSARETLEVFAGDATFTAAGDVTLSTFASTARLIDGGGEVTEFATFSWDTSVDFDEFENLFPATANVRTVLLTAADGSALQLDGPTRVTLELYDADSSSDAASPWVEVWSLAVGAPVNGSTLHSISRVAETLGRAMAVGGFRLRADPPLNPTFVSWGKGTITLGVGSAGTLALASLGVIEAVGVEAVRLASAQTVDISSAGSVDVAAGGDATLHAADTVTLSAGAEVGLVSNAIWASAVADVTLTAGGSLVAGATDVKLTAAGAMAANAGGDFELGVGGDAAVTADGGLSLAAGTIDTVATTDHTMSSSAFDVKASEWIDVAAAEGVAVATGDLSVHTVSRVDVTGSEVALSANNSIAVVAGRTVTVSADEVELTAAGMLTATTKGGVSIDTAAGIGLTAASDITLSSGGSVNFSSAGGVRLATSPPAAAAEQRRRAQGGNASNATFGQAVFELSTAGDAVLSAGMVGENGTVGGASLALTAADGGLEAAGAAVSVHGAESVDVFGGDSISLSSANSLLMDAVEIDMVAERLALAGNDLTVSVVQSVDIAAGTAANLSAAESVGLAAGQFIDLAAGNATRITAALADGGQPAAELAADSDGVRLHSRAGELAASVEVRHGGGTVRGGSGISLRSDELSFSGTLLSGDAERLELTLTGILVASGSTLFGVGSHFESELKLGDVVRPSTSAEIRLVVGIHGDGQATLDSPFSVRVDPATPFIARRPLLHFNQDSTGGSSSSGLGTHHRGGPVVVTADGRVGIGVDAPTAALEVDGSIKSTLWEVTKVLPYAVAPLPRASTVATHGGTWQLTVGASLLRLAEGDPFELSVEVLVDGQLVGALAGYTEAVGQAIALVSDTILLSGISAGEHTVLLRAASGASTTSSVSHVVLTELPF